MRAIEEIQRRTAAHAQRQSATTNNAPGALVPRRLSLPKTEPIALTKDDQALMEHPMFSLSKTPDLTIRVYAHNGNSITITPSANGLATIWDKDVSTFAISTLIEAQNRGIPTSRNVRLRVHDLLVYCNRGVDGAEYDGLVRALEQPVGTRIKTDITTGQKRTRRGFGLIESWSIVERTSSNRMACIELTLSEWLYNAVVAPEVLTLSPDYFRLRKGLERRLYELARKHFGLQAKFAIGLDTLLKESGAMCSLKEFRRQIIDVVTSNALPDYSLEFDPAGDVVTIWTRDGGKRLRRMIAEVQERGIATLDGILAEPHLKSSLDNSYETTGFGTRRR